MTSAALVFRAIGRPGSSSSPRPDGPGAEAARRGAQAVERVAPGVPVHTIRVGEGGGDDVVSVRKVASVIQRKKPVLNKAEMAAVNKRLKALGGVRPPIPGHGPDPGARRPEGDARALSAVGMPDLGRAVGPR